MTTNSVSIDGPNINVKEMVGSNPHRRVVQPGRLENGEWVDTDLSGESEAVREAAATAWTSEVTASFRAMLEAAAAPTPLTLEDYRLAIQSHVDQTARVRRYDGGVSLASYVASGNPAWAAEAVAFVAWRDAVWIYAYGELAKVEAQERPIPSVEDFMGELPAISWPE